MGIEKAYILKLLVKLSLDQQVFCSGVLSDQILQNLLVYFIHHCTRVFLEL